MSEPKREYQQTIGVVEQELKLLEVVREIHYGEVVATVQNSEIVLIEERKRIKP